MSAHIPDSKSTRYGWLLTAVIVGIAGLVFFAKSVWRDTGNEIGDPNQNNVAFRGIAFRDLSDNNLQHRLVHFHNSDTARIRAGHKGLSAVLSLGVEISTIDK